MSNDKSERNKECRLCSCMHAFMVHVSAYLCMCVRACVCVCASVCVGFDECLVVWVGV